MPLRADEKDEVRAIVLEVLKQKEQAAQKPEPKKAPAPVVLKAAVTKQEEPEKKAPTGKGGNK